MTKDKVNMKIRKICYGKNKHKNLENIRVCIVEILEKCLCEGSTNEVTTHLRKLIEDEKEDHITAYYIKFLENKTAYCKLFRFAVYYCIFSYYVEVSCINKMYSLIDMYGSEFFQKFDDIDYNEEQYEQDRVDRFVAHNYSIYSQYHIFKYRENGLEQDYEASAKYAEAALEKIKDSRGVYQNYAGIIALGFETKYEGMTQEQLQRAFVFIEKAIDLKKDYGLYYCTLGRLQAIQGNYNDAEKNINKAIMLEDIDKNTTHRRIARYYMYLADVRLQKKEKEIADMENELSIKQKEKLEGAIKKSQEQLEENMRQQQVKNIELLTFFSGILALIITIAGSIGVSDIFTENIGMIWSMGGIVLLSFSLLFGIFDYVNLKKRKCAKWIVISLVLAALLLVGGILIGRCLY